MATTEPNMGLILPTIGGDSGLLWEQYSNANTTIIGSHTHSAGNGIAIQPSGLNLSSDLTFQDNSATNLKSIIFTDQSSFATIRSLYTIAGNLFFNDGASNVVQITTGGTVNATSSGISSGANTASFVSNVLVVNAAANTPANIQSASILLGNNVAASKFLTLSPPAAMGSNYTITLPPLPGSTLPLVLDSSGNIGTAQITTAQLTDSSVTTAKIASASVTKPKLAAVGLQTSSTSNGSTTSTSYQSVSGMTLSITTTGRPVFILVCSADVQAYIGGENLTSSNVVSFFAITRDGTVISENLLENLSSGGSNFDTLYLPPNISYIDAVGAGTYVYTFKIKSNASTTTTKVNNCKIMAYEL